MAGNLNFLWTSMHGASDPEGLIVKCPPLVQLKKLDILSSSAANCSHAKEIAPLWSVQKETQRGFDGKNEMSVRGNQT